MPGPRRGRQIAGALIAARVGTAVDRRRDRGANRRIDDALDARTYRVGAQVRAGGPSAFPWRPAKTRPNVFRELEHALVEAAVVAGECG
jgi:hypothetical protein